MTRIENYVALDGPPTSDHQATWSSQYMDASAVVAGEHIELLAPPQEPAPRVPTDGCRLIELDDVNELLSMREFREWYERITGQAPRTEVGYG